MLSTTPWEQYKSSARKDLNNTLVLVYYLKKTFLIVGLLTLIVLSGCVGVIEPITVQTMSILKTDPTNAAIEGVNNVFNKPGELKTSSAFGFNADYKLSSSAIAQRMPISGEQICFSLGEFAGSTDFEWSVDNEGNQNINYTGQGVNAKLKTVCAMSTDELADYIAENNLESGDSRVHCDSIQGRACLLYLVKA